MKSIGLSLTLFTALALSTASPAQAKEGRLSTLAKSPVARKVARGAMRVTMFGTGLAMMLGAKTMHAMGDSATAGALGAGGLNLVVGSFRKDITEGAATHLALTATAATGGYLIGGADHAFGLTMLGAVSAAGSTIGTLVTTAVTHD